MVSRIIDAAADLFRRFPDPDGPVRDATTLRIEDFREARCVFAKRVALLKRSFALAGDGGWALEFGVDTGRSIRALARAAPRRRIVGFDSFEGLPEDWVRSESSVYPAGTFAARAMPKVPANVTLVPGFFDASLPAWLETNPGEVAFLHVDSDLYSSARTILSLLDARIGPGAVIVFDDLCDWSDSGRYPNWAEGEWRAFVEWLRERGRAVRVLGRSEGFSAAVQVTR